VASLQNGRPDEKQRYVRDREGGGGDQAIAYGISVCIVEIRILGRRWAGFAADVYTVVVTILTVQGGSTAPSSPPASDPARQNQREGGLIWRWRDGQTRGRH
jgi:hypothetical protein